MKNYSRSSIFLFKWSTILSASEVKKRRSSKHCLMKSQNTVSRPAWSRGIRARGIWGLGLGTSMGVLRVGGGPPKEEVNHHNDHTYMTPLGCPDFQPRVA